MRACCVSILTLALLAPAAATAKKGLYFGFNLGGSTVSGDTYPTIDLKAPTKDPDFLAPNSNRSVLLSTEQGQGFAADFRLGYNILGFVAIEFDAAFSGTDVSDYDKIALQGGLIGLIRFFPAQFAPSVADRWWDPYVFAGAGGHVMYYNPVSRPNMQNDGRAFWPGVAVKYGFGCDFYPVSFISIGVDLAFTHTFHDKFQIDNEKDLSSELKDTGKSFIFTGSVSILFHFFTG